MEDADLLRHSLCLNYELDCENMKARHKIIWLHIRACSPLLLLQHDCDDSIGINLMPRVFALISHVQEKCVACQTASAKLLCHQYEAEIFDNDEAASSRSDIDTIRLDAIYRIVQARPELCSESRSDTLKPSDSQREIRELSSVNKRLIAEIERLSFASVAVALVFVVIMLRCYKDPIRYS